MMEKLARVVDGIEGRQIPIQPLSMLVETYRARGLYAAADRFLARALTDAEDGLGADYMQSIAMRNNLAVLCKYAGEVTLRPSSVESTGLRFTARRKLQADDWGDG
jgi:hypothetical protein